MTSRVRRFTMNDEKEIFSSWLKNAVDLGVPPKIPNDLRHEIYSAIMVIVNEYPDITNPSIKKAKAAFADYLDSYRD